MGVYETAKKLANDIRDSKEYKDFKKNMKVIKSNSNYELILNNYKVLDMDIKSKQLRGIKVDNKTLNTYKDLKKKISLNKNLVNYLESEKNFTNMMDKINKILASSVYEDYK